MGSGTQIHAPGAHCPPEEELLNSITHGIGIALSIAGLSVLVSLAALRSDAWAVVGCSIYGACLVLLYVASTVYHSVRGPRLKHICRMIDHSFIFLLIAGTYTPFALTTLRGPLGWAVFGVMWGMAITGVILKCLTLGKFKVLSVLLYIFMGWFVVFVLKPVVQATPPVALFWLAVGGVSYTLGVVFYAWKRLPYNHAIWHLFVLGGSITQFFGVAYACIK